MPAITRSRGRLRAAPATQPDSSTRGRSRGRSHGRGHQARTARSRLTGQDAPVDHPQTDGAGRAQSRATSHRARSSRSRRRNRGTQRAQMPGYGGQPPRPLPARPLDAPETDLVFNGVFGITKRLGYTLAMLCVVLTGLFVAVGQNQARLADLSRTTACTAGLAWDVDMNMLTSYCGRYRPDDAYPSPMDSFIYAIAMFPHVTSNVSEIVESFQQPAYHQSMKDSWKQVRDRSAYHDLFRDQYQFDDALHNFGFHLSVFNRSCIYAVDDFKRDAKPRLSALKVILRKVLGRRWLYEIRHRGKNDAKVQQAYKDVITSLRHYIYLLGSQGEELRRAWHDLLSAHGQYVDSIAYQFETCARMNSHPTGFNEDLCAFNSTSERYFARMLHTLGVVVPETLSCYQVGVDVTGISKKRIEVEADPRFHHFTSQRSFYKAGLTGISQKLMRHPNFTSTCLEDMGILSSLPRPPHTEALFALINSVQVAKVVGAYADRYMSKNASYPVLLDTHELWRQWIKLNGLLSWLETQGQLAESQRPY